MADKATTSSLLEAIKNKLNKFDNKSLSADKNSSNSNNSNTNYFSAENQTQLSNSNETIITDQAISNLDIDESLQKIGDKIGNNKPDLSTTQESDLDIDDESLNIKNISQQISIDSKLKEIAQEVNNQNNSINLQSLASTSNNTSSLNLDPIEQELLELENQINLKKQQSQNTSQSAEIDDDLKNYLDSKFEPEINQINQQISQNQDLNSDLKIEKPDIADNSSNLDNSSVYNSSQIIENKNIFEPTQSQPSNLDFLNTFGKKFSPASDYLAKILSDNENQISNQKPISQSSDIDKSINDLNLNSIDENQANSSISSIDTPINQTQIVSNEIKNSNTPLENLSTISEPKIENITSNATESTPNNSLNNSSSPQSIFDDINQETSKEQPYNLKSSTEDSFNSKVHKQDISSNITPNTTFNDLSQNDQKITENTFSTPNINPNNIQQNQSSSNQDPTIVQNQIEDIAETKKSDEIKKSINFERINYNLIREETAYQANNSIKKLVEAKQMIKSVNNFAHNDILNKIAISLMEPKLEKWLNENLPDMVEGIVREEIEKIVSKE